MKSSIVLTVLNEEKTVDELLKALVSQSTEPFEIIIVDAGSNDKTIEVIKKYQKENRKIKLLIKSGANRSQGRNIGIEKAQGGIIAVTDAGCIPKKDWLEEITQPFKNSSIDVVSGYYKPKANTVLQKSLAVFTCVFPHQLNPEKFLPASRSIAFRKSIWEKAGGYPEELDTCEDMVFVQKLKKAGAKFKFSKDAVVYWKQHNSWTKAFKQFFYYAKGDGQALYMPHLKKIALVWLRYLIALIILWKIPLLLLFILPQYFAWVIGKGYFFVKNKKALFILPLLQIISDIAVMSGSLVGLVKRLTKG